MPTTQGSFDDTNVGVDTTLAAGVDLVLDAATGSMIATNAAQKLGFHGATPIIQASGTGELIGIVGFADSAANATNMTSNGNIGTKAYSFTDVVKALKLKGIMAAS